MTFCYRLGDEQTQEADATSDQTVLLQVESLMMSYSESRRYEKKPKVAKAPASSFSSEAPAQSDEEVTSSRGGVCGVPRPSLLMESGCRIGSFGYTTLAITPCSIEALGSEVHNARYCFALVDRIGVANASGSVRDPRVCTMSALFQTMDAGDGYPFLIGLGAMTVTHPLQLIVKAPGYAVTPEQMLEASKSRMKKVKQPNNTGTDRIVSCQGGAPDSACGSVWTALNAWNRGLCPNSGMMVPISLHVSVVLQALEEEPNLYIPLRKLTLSSNGVTSSFMVGILHVKFLVPELLEQFLSLVKPHRFFISQS